MTSVQKAAADIAITTLREKELLTREQRNLHKVALAAGLDSPEYNRWVARCEQINRKIDRLGDTLMTLLDGLTNEDEQAVSHMVATAVPDRWFDIPNALPPEER